MWRYMRPFTSLLYAPSPVVRRMGAFSLANLLQGPENRRLFVNEEGRGCQPLQCSAWCKDQETRQLARDAMSEVSLMFTFVSVRFAFSCFCCSRPIVMVLILHPYKRSAASIFVTVLIDLITCWSNLCRVAFKQQLCPLLMRRDTAAVPVRCRAFCN